MKTELCGNNREKLKWAETKKKKKKFKQARGENGAVLGKRKKKRNNAFSYDQCQIHDPACPTSLELLLSVFLKCHFTFSLRAQNLMSENYVCTVSGVMQFSVCNTDKWGHFLNVPNTPGLSWVVKEGAFWRTLDKNVPNCKWRWIESVFVCVDTFVLYCETFHRNYDSIEIFS